MCTAPESTGGLQAAIPTVSVVVATRDRPAMLAETLACLRDEPCEVVVVDSASADASTVEMVAREWGTAYLRCDVPGASRARNLGARVAGGRLLAFTDDDCRPVPGWARAVEAAFADPVMGFVAGQVIPDVQGPAPVSTLAGTAPRTFVGLVDPIEIGHGANMAVRRVAFEAVGGFDERLGAGAPFRGAEDHDLLYRVLVAGWTGSYDPSAVVVHHQWRTRAQSIGVQFGYGLGAGAFAAKHARLDPRRAWRLAARRLWRDGLGQVGRDLSSGYRTGVAMSVVRTVGVACGLTAGAVAPLRDGRYTA